MLRMLAGSSCLALFLLVLACDSWAQPGAPLRAEVALPDWRFQPGALGVEPVAADWAPVRLPYAWTATWTRPRAAETTSWARRDLRDVNSGWYEADVTVPAEWAGRRVFLELRGVQCDAVVWLAGKPLGEVKGPDGRVDLTAAAPPGSSQRMRLWVTRWWEGTRNQRKDDLFRDLTIQSLSHSEWYHSENEARRAIPGGITGGVSLLALPAAGEVSRVAVATSVRRHELRVTLDYTLLTAAPGAQFALQVAEMNGSTAGLPAATAAVEDTSGDGTLHSQSLTLPWSDPHLWEVGAPYLYRLRVALVGADGKPLDAPAPVRFGFREIWAQGRELILNGHPLHLRPSYFVQSVNAMRFFEGMGFNTIAFQPNPSGWYGAWGLFPGGVLQGGNTQELLDAADENGWAVLMPVPGVSTIRDAILSPEAEAPYLRDLRMWLAELDRGNRPCILMWTPSMNTASISSPENVGRLPSTRQPGWYSKVEELIRSVDPTRLIYHHQGGQNGDVQTSNIYLNWVPLAEQEEYLSAWARNGERPWGGIEHGAPLSMDYFKRAMVPLYTEYAAISLGDAAYALEKDDYVTASLRAQETKGKSAFDGVRAFRAAGGLATLNDSAPYFPVVDRVVRGVNRSWRAWGLNGGIFPWFFDVGFGAPPGYKPGNMGYLYETLTGTPEELHERPTWANPLYDAYRDTMQPLLVYLGGPPSRFTAVEPRYTVGEQAERSIVAVWDGPGERSFVASWELQIGGKAALSGAESFRMTAGAIEKRPLRFTVPQVSGRTDAVLTLTVRDAAGTEFARDEQPLTVFPPMPPSAPPLMARWGLLDPSGRTATDWAQVGLRARTVKVGDSLEGLDVLVIGADALKDAPRLPFNAADVARGLRVLILEQGLSALEALGFRVQDVVPRQVFPRVKDHPVLAGLTAADLCDWRGAGQLLPATSAGMRVWPWPHGPHCGNTGSVASVVIETPHRGAFTPLLECEFDLAYTPLLSWRHGAGEVLFSQLDFTGRLGAEPAAGILARNLIRYLDAPSAVKQTKEALLIGDGAAGKAFLAELGIRWRAADAAALAAADPASRVVIVGPGDGSAARQHQRALSDFVAAGGTVVFLPQDAANLGRAGLPWPLPLENARAARVTARDMGQDPLLRGIGPQLVHWRSFLEDATFAAEGLPEGARRLMGGWLLRVPEGAGGWVFLQLDWRKLEDGTDNLRRTRWNVRKLYAQLLTNLGVATEDAIAQQMLASRGVAPVVNVQAWQVLQQAVPFDPTVAADRTLPGLGTELAAERWVQKPVAETSRDFTWRLRAADANGYVDLSHVAPAKLGQAGYAVTHIFSSAARTATLAVSADYWLVFRVNGAAVVDQSASARPGNAPRPGELRLRVPLQAGWNRLEARVASGSGGFGFWCQISDPGDLRVSPTLTAPEGGAAPLAAADLRPEPLVAGPNLLYTEALQKEDDPYGFSPW